LLTVPIAPVALHRKEGLRHLIGAGLDFLQADDVGAVARNPLFELRVTRPDAVDVPGGDFQKRACAACRSAAGTAMMSAWSATCFFTMASACAMVSASPLRYTALASMRSF